MLSSPSPIAASSSARSILAYSEVKLSTAFSYGRNLVNGLLLLMQPDELRVESMKAFTQATWGVEIEGVKAPFSCAMDYRGATDLSEEGC